MKLNIMVCVSLFFLLISSCDTVIHPTLQLADPVYVVDAFINNGADTQIVRLTKSQPYFEATIPPGVSGATVTITDNENTVYSFTEKLNQQGVYIWVPGGIPFGKVGNVYSISVKIGVDNLISVSKMGRVPVIDSITFESGESGTGTDHFYRAQFYATDPKGSGDTYWIRAYKNGLLLNKPSDINLAYDAAFSKGSNFDGFPFIQPIRSGINPNDTDSNNKRLSPYLPGDSVYVQIHSLNEASFNFLNEVALQTDRPGGFSELFARPLSNVSTNITNLNTSGIKVQGFFNVGSVSGLGKRFVFK